MLIKSHGNPTTWAENQLTCVEIIHLYVRVRAHWMCHWTSILERVNHQVRKNTNDLRHIITAQNYIACSNPKAACISLKIWTWENWDIRRRDTSAIRFTPRLPISDENSCRNTAKLNQVKSDDLRDARTYWWCPQKTYESKVWHYLPKIYHYGNQELKNPWHMDNHPIYHEL